MRPTPDAHCLLPVIDAIYAAGLDESRWQAVAEVISALVPGAGCGIHAYSGDARQFGFSVAAGYDPRTVADFTGMWATHDPWAATAMRQAPGQLIVIDQHAERDANRHTQFQADFILPHGLGSGVGLKLRSDEHSLFWVSIDYAMARSAQLDEGVAGLASALAPHMLRAFEINRLHRVAHSAERTASALIEQIDAPALVVDAGLRIRLANNQGQAALDSRRGLARDRVDRLLVADRKAAERIAAVVGQRDGLLQAQRQASSVVPFEIPGEELVGTVLMTPMLADAGLSQWGTAGAGFERLTMLVVRYPDREQTHIAADWAALFGLTRAEAELAEGILQGASLAQIAERRRVHLDTVRAQLKAVFRKTGVSRQSELVAKLAAAGRVLPIR